MKYSNKVSFYIKKNRFDDAFKLLETISDKLGDDVLKKDVTLLTGRFNALKQKRRVGTMNEEEAIFIENSIRESLFELFNAVSEYDELIDKDKSLINIDDIIIDPDDDKSIDSFNDWVLKLLSKDINVTILVGSIVLSIIAFFFINVKIGFGTSGRSDVSSYLVYGIIANFVISFISFITPLISYLDKDYNDSLVFRNLWKYPNKNSDDFDIDFPELKLSLGFETNFGIQKYYERAYGEFKRFDKNWRRIWLWWMLLYLTWLANFVYTNSYDMSWSDGFDFSKSKIPFASAEILFNSVAHLFMLFAFLILYFKKEDDIQNNLWKFCFIILCTVVVIVGICYNRTDNNLELIVGSFAGFSIALLAGRLDSLYLQVPFWIIIILYIYAIIQPLIEEFPDENSIDTQIIMALVINIALVAKSVLFLMMAWLVHTNRFMYYLISSYREELELDTNWKTISKQL